MKNTVAGYLVAGAVLVAIALAWQHPEAKAAGGSPILSADVGVGDKVELYLDRTRSGSQVYLSGDVKSIDLIQIVITSKEGGPGYTRDVQTWVPLNSLIYVNRITNEKFTSPK